MVPEDAALVTSPMGRGQTPGRESADENVLIQGRGGKRTVAVPTTAPNKDGVRSTWRGVEGREFPDVACIYHGGM
jgi:hypothetical protein